MMICRRDEGLLYHHRGTNSMSPPKELCFLHVQFLDFKHSVPFLQEIKSNYETWDEI